MKTPMPPPPRHIKCLQATLAYVGDRKHAAEKLGITVAGITQWIMKNRIPSDHITTLVKLSDGHFKAEDFLPPAKGE